MEQENLHEFTQKLKGEIDQIRNSRTKLIFVHLLFLQSNFKDNTGRNNELRDDFKHHIKANIVVHFIALNTRIV